MSARPRSGFCLLSVFHQTQHTAHTPGGETPTAQLPAAIPRAREQSPQTPALTPCPSHGHILMRLLYIPAHRAPSSPPFPAAETWHGESWV